MAAKHALLSLSNTFGHEITLPSECEEQNDVRQQVPGNSE